jgi:hypothetical protein
MKELTLEYMKSLIFNYVEEKVSKTDFVDIMLEHVNLLQILIEEEKLDK